jgi:hypothetical protein
MDENSQQIREPLRRPVRAIPQQEEKKKERIPVWMAAALITVAASIDIFEAILGILIVGEFINPVISICADVGFWIWFKMLGVEFTKDPKNLTAMATQALIGLIPGLDILPELTLGVVAIVIFTRIVDKSNALGKLAGATQGKI